MPKLLIRKHSLLCEGIEQIAGDMFESVPTGDAILMKVSELHEGSILYF